MRAPRRPFRRDAHGSVAVEFAIIAPIVIVILAGLYEIGHAFQALTAVNALASQYAISWADCQDNPVGACGTETGLYTTPSAIANLAPQLTATRVTVQMFQVTMSGTTPVPTAADTYPSSATLSPAQISAAQASLTNGQIGVIVTVSYTYSVSIFPVALSGVAPSTIPMSYTMVQLKS